MGPTFLIPLNTYLLILTTMNKLIFALLLTCVLSLCAGCLPIFGPAVAFTLVWVGCAAFLALLLVWVAADMIERTKEPILVLYDDPFTDWEDRLRNVAKYIARYPLLAGCLIHYTSMINGQFTAEVLDYMGWDYGWTDKKIDRLYSKYLSTLTPLTS